MKKSLLFIAIAMLGVSLKAQETRFGVKAGYSLSNLKFTDSEENYNTDPMHTYYFGGLVEHKLSDKFGLQAEVLYSPLGGKVVQTVEDEEEANVFFNLKSKSTFGTLLIPVSAKYFITEYLSVSAGASFGVILSAKQKTVFDAGFNIPGLELEGDDETDIKNQVNTLNIAPFLGAEFALENGLFFDARYNMGVSNLAKDSGDGKLTNSFAQVGVGFRFGGN